MTAAGSLPALTDYKLQTKVLEGNFGSVYKAVKNGSTTQVALKVLKPKKCFNPKKLLQTEYDTLLDCSHPNVVKVLDKFTDEKYDKHVIVMELMSHYNLEEYIHRELLNFYRLIPEAKIWSIFSQVVEGLKFVHSKGYVHGDLKSPNILFSGDVFKLGDFGSTQKVPEGGQLTTYTGSRNWCAPEKLNKEPYGVEAEVFELGNVLYELASGVYPTFCEGGGEYDLKKKVNEGFYPPLPEDCHSRFLKNLINLLLVVNKEDRPSLTFVSEYSKKMDKHFKKHSKNNESLQTAFGNF